MKKVHTDKEINNLRKLVNSKYIKHVKILFIIMLVVSLYSTAFTFYVSYKFYMASDYSFSELFEISSKPKMKTDIAPIDLYLTKYFWKSLTEIQQLLWVIFLYIFFMMILKYSNTIVVLDDKLKNNLKQ